MSDQQWGVVTTAWRQDGERRNEGLVRWNIQLGTAPQIPPLQVQGIPGEYRNDYESLLFTRDGAWYVTQGWEDNPPGVVFYAPFTTGVFGEVARFVPQDSEQLIPIPYPDGLVVGGLGTRWVRVITPSGGLVLEQELPPLPIPDAGEDWRSVIQPMFVVYSPDSGRIGLAIGAFAESDSPLIDGWSRWAEGVCFTDLVQPGSPMTVSGDIYMTPAGLSGGDPVSDGFLVAAAPGIYGERTILSVEPGRRARWWGSDWVQYLSKADAEGNVVVYEFDSGDEATGHIPVTSIAFGYKVVETGTAAWPGTSTVGRVFQADFSGVVAETDAPDALYDLPGFSYGYGLRPMWTPLPSTPPFWTAFNRTIEVIGVGEVLPPQPDPDPDPEPSGDYVDFVVTAGDGGWAVGFIDWLDNAAGGVVPASPVFGGVTGVLRALAWGDDALVAIVDGIYGASGAVMVIGDSEFRLDIWPDYIEGVQAVVPIAESPFEVGQTYDVRLYLEGDLRDTP